VAESIEDAVTKPFENPDRGTPGSGRVPGVNLNVRPGKVPELTGMKLPIIVGNSAAMKKASRAPAAKKDEDDADGTSPPPAPQRKDEPLVDGSDKLADFLSGRGTNTTQDPTPGAGSDESDEERCPSDGN
jgi:hypothetical protein